MTDNENKVLLHIVNNPRAELQQICVGAKLPVAQAFPAIESLLSSGFIEMSYGTGGAGTQYIATKLKINFTRNADAAHERGGNDGENSI